MDGLHTRKDAKFYRSLDIFRSDALIVLDTQSVVSRICLNHCFVRVDDLVICPVTNCVDGNLISAVIGGFTNSLSSSSV